MKRFLNFGAVLLCCFALTGIALAQDDIQKFPSCKFCGMDRAKFAHSRVLLDYDDGTAEGTCSIHCAAVDLALNLDKTPKAIRVGDFNTHSLVDVDTATWVIGGNQMGVMTKNAKWAFEKKEDAEKFVKENGGKLATFDEVMQASYDDMHMDTKMIRERRKMKKMQMEQKPMEHKPMEHK